MAAVLSFQFGSVICLQTLDTNSFFSFLALSSVCLSLVATSSAFAFFSFCFTTTFVCLHLLPLTQTRTWMLGSTAVYRFDRCHHHPTRPFVFLIVSTPTQWPCFKPRAHHFSMVVPLTFDQRLSKLDQTCTHTSIHTKGIYPRVLATTATHLNPLWRHAHSGRPKTTASFSSSSASFSVQDCSTISFFSFLKLTFWIFLGSSSTFRHPLSFFLFLSLPPSDCNSLLSYLPSLFCAALTLFALYFIAILTRAPSSFFSRRSLTRLVN